MCLFSPQAKVWFVACYDNFWGFLYINILVRLRMKWGEESGALIFHKIEEMGKKAGFFVVVVVLTSRNCLVSYLPRSLFHHKVGEGWGKTPLPCGVRYSKNVWAE